MLNSSTILPSGPDVDGTVTVVPSRFRREPAATVRPTDIDGLESLFAADVDSLSSGGSIARSSGLPAVARNRVSAFVSRISRRFWPGSALTWTEANGRTAAVVSSENRVVAMVTVAASPHGIDQIKWMINPARVSGLPASPRQHVQRRVRAPLGEVGARRPHR